MPSARDGSPLAVAPQRRRTPGRIGPVAWKHCTLRHLSIDTVPHISIRRTMSAATVPDKPALEGLEEKWGGRWQSDGTFLFDRAAALAAERRCLFSIDTPPPTASGSLHIGH